MSNPSTKQIDAAKTVLGLFPKAEDCIKGHIGPTVLTFFEEENDDRYDLLIVPRCGHCGIPVDGDDYANEENKERFYAGLDPVPQD